MKKTIFIITLSSFVLVTLITGCQTSAEKVNDAKSNLADAKQELTQARKDSIQQFREESLEKISHYEKSMIEFKAGMGNNKKEINDEYKSKMADLEQKSNDLKNKLENYKEEGVDNWESFKNEFNHDMEEFGKSFKDLTVNNVK